MPGHGFSSETLEIIIPRVQVSNITTYGGSLAWDYGANVKSWRGGAKDIKFMNMVMDNVKNRIIINQNYCITADPSKPKLCQQQESTVQSSSILFKNMIGTTATKDVIKLHSSKALTCSNIVLQDIDL